MVKYNFVRTFLLTAMISRSFSSGPGSSISVSPPLQFSMADVRDLIFVPGKTQPFKGYVAGFDSQADGSDGIAQISTREDDPFRLPSFSGVGGTLAAGPVTVNALALGTQEEVYVGGAFIATNVYGGITNLARFKAFQFEDGRWIQGLRVDQTFQPRLQSIFDPRGGTVSALAVQPDGKILAAGLFYDNTGYEVGLLRLNIDGTWDTNFFLVRRIQQRSPQPYDQPPKVIRLQSDGKIIIGGDFSRIQGLERNAIVRLNTNGVFDASFFCTLDRPSVEVVAVYPDDRMLIAGGFNQVNGRELPALARLNRDGTPDPTFVVPDIGGFPLPLIKDIAIQADQKVLLVGNFNWINGVSRENVARLNSDGSLDLSFDVGSGAGQNGVSSLALEDEGIALGIAGSFSAFNGEGGGGFARLRLTGGFPPTAPAIVQQPRGQTVVHGQTIVFTPEVKGFPLEVKWFRDGIPIHGATNTHFAIRGATLSDTGDWTLVASNFLGAATSNPVRITVTTEAPIIIRQPQSSSLPASSTLQLTVEVTGTPAPLFQWLFQGEILEGQTNSVLTIPNMGLGQAGAYKVSIRNVAGEILSAAANVTVTIEPPTIRSQPADLAVPEGETIILSTVAGGAPSPGYQWYFNGLPLAAQTNASLNISNAQSKHAGGYAVTVENLAGRQQSRSAMVTIISAWTLTTALDQYGINWSTGGAADWTFQTESSFDLSDAAQAGRIGHGQTSFISAMVQGPAIISFQTKVSSEAGFDGLRFLIDGVQAARITGESNWTKHVFPLTTGEHLLRWEYFKDEGGSSGADTAWLDTFTFSSLRLQRILYLSRGIGFSVSVANGQAYDIQSSMNLKNWSNFRTGIGNGLVQAIEAPLVDDAQFFRLILP